MAEKRLSAARWHKCAKPALKGIHYFLKYNTPFHLEILLEWIRLSQEGMISPAPYEWVKSIGELKTQLSVE